MTLIQKREIPPQPPPPVTYVVGLTQVEAETIRRGLGQLQYSESGLLYGEFGEMLGSDD